MKVRVIFLICLIYILSGCAKPEVKPYLSITVTYYDNGIDSTGGMSIAVYQYSFDTGAAALIGDTAYDSQYPLAVYDKENDVIYFTASDKNGADQLWKYDVSDNSTMKLTDTFWFLNHIIPMDQKVFLAGAPVGSKLCSPYIFDIQSGELFLIETDKPDFSCSQCIYNIYNQQLVISGNLYGEERETMSEWNSLPRPDSNHTPPYIPPDSYIYEINGYDSKYILKKDRYDINNLGVSIDSNSLYFTGTDQRYASYPDESFEILEDGELKEVLENIPFTIKNSYYVYDDNLIFLGAGNKGNDYPYGIYSYSISTHEVSMIFKGSDNLPGGYINGFIMLGASQ